MANQDSTSPRSARPCCQEGEIKKLLGPANGLISVWLSTDSLAETASPTLDRFSPLRRILARRVVTGEADKNLGFAEYFPIRQMDRNHGGCWIGARKRTCRCRSLVPVCPLMPKIDEFP